MSEIRLGIYTPPKGGFGIHVVSISGKVLDYEYNGQRIFRNLLKVPDTETKAFTTSERLKHTNTQESAQDYIARFYLRPIEEQITIIAGKNLKSRPTGRNFVVVNVKYYKIMRYGRVLTTTYNRQEVERIVAMYTNCVVVPSVCKQMKFEKTDYEKNKHILTEVAATPKARNKNDIWRGNFVKYQAPISQREYNPRTGVLIGLTK